MTETPNVQTVVAVAESKATELKTYSNSVVSWCSSSWRALLAEFVATTMLVFLGCMTCVPIDGHNPQPTLNAPLGFGFIIMINTQTFGHISGAHMNPCITLLAIMWGKMSIVLAIGYFLAQCTGAILASWLLYFVSPVDMAEAAICVTAPHVKLGVWECLIIEVALTGLLCWITCAVWDPVNEKNQDSTPLKFGLTIAGLSIAGGPLTGASMNPVRSLGPALVSGVWTAHWIYWVGPFLGSALTGTVYIFTWLNRKQSPITTDPNVST